MPFTDPMADGPAIQAAGVRALKAGQTMKKTLATGARLPQSRRRDADRADGLLQSDLHLRRRSLPRRREGAGVDGLIVVDLPPEEDEELCLPALKAGLNFIRLATPTTDDKRLPAVLNNTSGFVYYVSITGITGAAAPDAAKVGDAVARIKRHTKLPVAVGFGVRTAEQARAIAEGADGVVVGSALVDALRASLDKDGKAGAGTVKAVTGSGRGSWPKACAARAAWRRSRRHSRPAAILMTPNDRAVYSVGCHELDLQRRPAEDPQLPQPPRDAGKSLDQVSGDRAARVLQGRRGQPVRHPRFRTITCA